MEQKTTQDPARLLRVQAVSAASKGLSPTLPIWVGVCARRQGLTAEQQRKRRARVCKRTHACTHVPWHGEPRPADRVMLVHLPRGGEQAGVGTAAGTLAAAGVGYSRFILAVPGVELTLLPAPARPSSASSPPAQRLLPPVSMGTQQENTISSKATTSPSIPNPRSELPHQGVCLEDTCARPCPHVPSPQPLSLRGQPETWPG